MDPVLNLDRDPDPHIGSLKDFDRNSYPADGCRDPDPSTNLNLMIKKCLTHNSRNSR